jgi:hypothetical protein
VLSALVACSVLIGNCPERQWVKDRNTGWGAPGTYRQAPRLTLQVPAALQAVLGAGERLSMAGATKFLRNECACDARVRSA